MTSFIDTIYRVHRWLGSKDLERNEPEISIEFRRADEFFAAVDIIREELANVNLIRPGTFDVQRKFGRYIFELKLFGLRVKLQTER